jgi:hypothetical protein
MEGMITEEGMVEGMGVGDGISRGFADVVSRQDEPDGQCTTGSRVALQ